MTTTTTTTRKMNKLREREFFQIFDDEIIHFKTNININSNANKILIEMIPNIKTRDEITRKKIDEK